MKHEKKHVKRREMLNQTEVQNCTSHCLLFIQLYNFVYTCLAIYLSKVSMLWVLFSTREIKPLTKNT